MTENYNAVNDCIWYTLECESRDCCGCALNEEENKDERKDNRADTFERDPSKVN